MVDCIFCRIVSGEIPSATVAEDDLIVAFEDINPAAPVHVLVIPREHVRDVRDLSEPVLARMVRTANRVAVLRGVAESGYRLVFNTGRDGGQTVDHAHIHVLGGRAMAWPPG